MLTLRHAARKAHDLHLKTIRTLIVAHHRCMGTSNGHSERHDASYACAFSSEAFFLLETALHTHALGTFFPNAVY